VFPLKLFIGSRPTNETFMVLAAKTQPTITQTDYTNLTIPELKNLCKERGIKGISKLKKEEIIHRKNKSNVTQKFS
jgi:hypothetical protein